MNINKNTHTFIFTYKQFYLVNENLIKMQIIFNFVNANERKTIFKLRTGTK